MDGSTVAPARTVTYGGPDAYLVVAADKGTAQFSDLANSIAVDKGYWLGDAFASGGSTGYDHKAMGITARGAWVCVQEHFKTLGIDAARDTIRVVGIGDMSGDVFGNGMLLSRSLKLVAAFDHRHIFVDPNPDPACSYNERARLFAQPGSSWGDYNRAVLSDGGGVWPRTAKKIALSLPARQVLGVDATELSPDELIKAILTSPVDLLWNGGIGTYVKSSQETHAAASDPANDAVRVDGSELRCRVIGEGGNLGVTQRGRIEFALNGGRVNGDFIDNAAGVATSDREVNLKIALGAAVRRGTIDVNERDALLAHVQADIADAVLATNRNQDTAISLAESHAPALIHRHERLISHLETSNGLDRQAESLPAKRELAARAQRGKGLTRPEIAVLLAHSKNVVKAELLASTVPEEPGFTDVLLSYFPGAIRGQAGADIKEHQLARDIIATGVADDLINHVGPGLIYRLEERLAATSPVVARAYTAVRAVFGVDELWTAAQRYGQATLHAVQYFIERTASWLLQHRDGDLNVATEIARYQSAINKLTHNYPRPATREEFTAWLEFMGDAFAFHETALAHSCAITTVADVFHETGSVLGLDWTKNSLRENRAANWWDSMALASLQDELNTRHHALTSSILSLSKNSPLLQWQCLAAAPIARFTRLTAELKREENVDISSAATLNAELALLIRSTRASTTIEEDSHE
ncbi:NAD-glutamate dehydrogenase domain-containing protein [Hoyosella altamirensis]|uniref:NAD-glutamate dehydrogenase domain-containing protein n=1 Tax=Hoyosella altamirensis TaxID=616997 RepID=UPI000B137DB1|nr:NAD-glutamate dehydrogenase domain-containing protein [Hoyosella altamirensis]